MSENNSDHGHNEEGSFADLLESYSDRMNEDIRIGDQIKGEIISIGREAVYVDTGTKIDGVVEITELLDENGEMPHKVGDILELYVVQFDGNEIKLSKALSGVGELRLLEDAFQNAVPIEGKVKGLIKGGFQIEISRRRAFCPVSQMDLKYIENPEDYVGDTYPFLITRFEENGRNIVVSRRELLDKEQREVRKQFLQEIRPGAVLRGRVTKLMPYGAFVELFPGLQGMVHISELSWSRVDKPEDVLNIDDSVEVKILDIGPPEKNGLPKISLSLKQITGDPWDHVAEIFQEGEKVKGTVTRCMGFGAFVEIAPGIEGLVHISEMSYLKRITKPEEVVQVGETVQVMIKEIDTEKRRISLSIKDAEGDPWGDIIEKYNVGQAVPGTIEKKEKFGLFITLEPGITGLLPQSRIRKTHESASLEKMKPGDPIKVVIEEINPKERKITLSPSDLKEEDDWKQFTQSRGNGLGSLGEKLRQAMESKEK